MNPTTRQLARHFVLATTTSFLLTAAAHAHHGRDFLVVQDYSLPSPLSGNVITNFSWERTDSADEFQLEPGFIVGLAPRLALETSVGFLDEEDGWEYASVDPSLHLQLTPPTSTFPIRVGLSAGYQFGNLDTEVEDDAHSAGHDHHEDHTVAAVDHDHADDHAADGHTHEHTGIHRHGEDYFHARLVLETDFTESLKGVFNLIAVVPRDGGASWGYSAGLRYAFNHAVAIGVEGIGDFEAHGEHELIAAGYFSPVHALSFKLGLGCGLTEESPDVAVHTGVVWRF